MLDSERTDLALLHAQNEALESFKEFLYAYFQSRLPTPEEIATQLQLPVDLVIEAMMQEEI